MHAISCTISFNFTNFAWGARGKKASNYFSANEKLMIFRMNNSPWHRRTHRNMHLWMQRTKNKQQKKLRKIISIMNIGMSHFCRCCRLSPTDEKKKTVCVCTSLHSTGWERERERKMNRSLDTHARFTLILLISLWIAFQFSTIKMLNNLISSIKYELFGRVEFSIESHRKSMISMRYLLDTASHVLANFLAFQFISQYLNFSEW